MPVTSADPAQRYEGLSTDQSRIVGDLIQAQIARQSAVFAAAQAELSAKWDKISDQMDEIALDGAKTQEWLRLSRLRSEIATQQNELASLFPKVLYAL